jgi:two-component sensor histidine kinase
MLAANEILSNGIEHSGQEQHVAISGSNRSFTLTILGGGTKRGMHMRPSGERGRGLRLVRALVDRLITTSKGESLITKLVVYR